MDHLKGFIACGPLGRDVRFRFVRPLFSNALRMLFRSIVLAVLTCIGAGKLAAQVIPTMGTEFWVGFMDNYDNSSVQLSLYISSYNNTAGTVTMPLLGYSQNFTVLANTVTTVTLPSSAINTGSDVVSNKSFLVQTDDTVAVYALNFQVATADAAAIFPTKTLGTDYIVHCYRGLDFSLPSEFLIVATTDDTQVEIIPATATAGGHAAGVPYIVDLDSAETYQVKAASGGGDLSGSSIRGTDISGSCRPFAVFSGAQCTNIPTGCAACDHVYEQNLPVNGWGKRYYTVPWVGPNSYTYRVMASTNGTTYTVDGVAQPPLNAGEFTEVNNAVGAKVIVSASPISVSQYIQGQDCSGGVGDPALLILNAIDQRITNVSFATVVSSNITSQSIGVVVETASSGQVVLDGNSIPASAFTPYTADPAFSHATFSLTQGSHSISCPTGLTGYVYGVGPNYETYAYSAGSFSRSPPITVDSVFCGVDSTGMLTLVAENGMNFPWWALYSDPEDTLHTGQSYTFTPVGSNVYVVTGSEFLSACPQQYFYSVEVLDPPVLTLSASATHVCAFEEVQLNVTAEPAGTYLYNWWPDASLSSGSIADPVATPAQSGWYYVSVSSLTGCSVAMDSIYISVTPGDVLRYDALVDDAQVCAGDTVQLQVVVYRNLVADTLDVVPNAAMWSTVTGGAIGDNCGALGANALYFNGPGPLRQAQTVDLDVSQGGLVRFSIKIANGAAPCDNVDPGENILVQFSTNGGGAWTTFNICYEYQYADWTQLELPVPAAAQTASTRFRWAQPTFTGAGEDNWSLDNVAIAALSGSDLDFAWSPSLTVADPTADSTSAWPTVTGWYHVASTDNTTGCAYADSIQITVGQAFTLDMTADTAICDVAGIQLAAVPSSGTNVTYLWTPNTAISSVVSATPLVTPVVTTTYSVTANSAEGCTATGDVVITVATLLSLNATVTDNDICAGDVVTFHAVVGNAGGLAFQWSPSAGLNDAHVQNPTGQPLQDTWYTVEVTDTTSGCILRDSVFIAVTNPGGIHAGNDTTVCSALGLSLEVVHGISNPMIQWQPASHLSGANTATPTIQFDSTMTYIVTVGDGTGCASMDTIVVTVAFPQVVLLSDSSLCAGDLAVLDPGFPGASRLWSTGDTSQTITVSTAGTYTCTLIDVMAACTVDAVTQITVDPLPIVQLGVDTSLCIGQSWTLNAGNPNSVVLWSTGATSQTITTNTAGSYSVSVTDAATCVGRDTILVTFDPLPVIVLADTMVCVSETITLDAGNPGSSYLWSPTGETTRNIQVNASSGTYSVIVTTPTVCVDSAQATLHFIPFPVVDLGPDTALCDLESITLDAGCDDCGILWSTGAHTRELTLYTGGDIQVHVFNGYCTTTDSIQVIFNPLPNELAAHAISTCFDYPPHRLELDAENPGNTYLWHPGGETSRTIVVHHYGSYTVDLTTPEHCTLSQDIIVNEYCMSGLYMPNTFTPNGDGHNELFRPDGTNLATMELYVFDRWGGVIRHGLNADAFWDGSRNGEPCELGVYTWKCIYRFFEDADKTVQGPEKEATGHVTLLR